MENGYVMPTVDRDVLLCVLQEAGEYFPDLRLGQLIVNVLPEKYKGDPYYISDVDLAKALLAYADQHGWLGSGDSKRSSDDDEKGGSEV